jgi:hypothetical protein
MSLKVMHSKLNLFIQTAKEIAANWESLPKDEHVPVGKNMIYLSIKSMGAAGFGKTFKDEKEANKFIEAYTMVSV